MKRQKVIVIGGPTGSGKSLLALDLGRTHKGVIINGDSLQLYKELRVLTARPGEEDLREVPHRLYGFLSGSETCSAAQWVAWAIQEIRQAFLDGKCPIVVGGTGLYLKALLEGLADIPPIDPHIREKWRAKGEKEGNASLYEVLKHQDPALARRLNPRDTQRVLRGLEVLESTGRSLLDWQAPPEIPPLDVDFYLILLLPPREELYESTMSRFEHMITAGAIEEVKTLHSHTYPPGSSMMKAIGVREIQAYLAEEISYEKMLALGKIATRQYVKRQYTWFRGQFSSFERCLIISSPEDPEVFKFLEVF